MSSPSGQVADHGGGVGPAFPCPRDVLRGDAADGDDGDPDPAPHGREHLEAAGRVARLLGPGGEHGAETDVVGSVPFRRFGLFRAVGGDADEPVAHQRPRGLQGQVVLPQVHAVGPGGQRDVHAVVDDEEAAGPGGLLPDRRGQVQELVGGTVLHPELEHRHAPGQHGVDDRGQRPPPGLGRVHDGIEPRGQTAHGSRLTVMRRSVIFLRRVLRLMPSNWAARIWLPRVAWRLNSIRGRSTLSMITE